MSDTRRSTRLRSRGIVTPEPPPPTPEQLEREQERQRKYAERLEKQREQRRIVRERREAERATQRAKWKQAREREEQLRIERDRLQAEFQREGSELNLALRANVAAEHGNYSELQRLIERGADLNYKHGEQLQYTALMHAVVHNNETIARLCLQARADPNLANWLRRSPIHVATENGFSGMVRLLLEHHANVNALGTFRETALHTAAACGNVEIAAILIDAGADKSIRNADRKTATQLASRPSMSEFLEKHQLSWSVATQHRAPRPQRLAIKTIVMIRTLVPNSPWSLMSNEILFYIFSYLVQ